MTKIVVTKITVWEGREGSTYIFTCPNCNQEIEIATWNKMKCKCGLTWEIKIQIEAVGKNEN